MPVTTHTPISWYGERTDVSPPREIVEIGAEVPQDDDDVDIMSVLSSETETAEMIGAEVCTYTDIAEDNGPELSVGSDSTSLHPDLRDDDSDVQDVYYQRGSDGIAQPRDDTKDASEFVDHNTVEDVDCRIIAVDGDSTSQHSDLKENDYDLQEVYNQHGFKDIEQRDVANDASDLLENLNSLEEIACLIVELGQAMQKLLDEQKFEQQQKLLVVWKRCIAKSKRLESEAEMPAVEPDMHKRMHSQSS